MLTTHHVIDFENSLYGKTIRIRFLHRLRGERKFSGLEELKMQIGKDRDTTVEYFATTVASRNFTYV